MSRQNLKFINPDSDTKNFFATLRKNVDTYFKENKISKQYNYSMVIKTVVLISAYILPFVAILVFQPLAYIAIPLWILMGVAQAGIGMCVMHDANHGAYSSKRKANYWLGNTINLLGGSGFNWKLQHNTLHHTYTNIPLMDDDIGHGAMMRFSPATKRKWYHKAQFIYAFLLYGALTLYWITLKDFVQFFKYKKDGVNKHSNKENALIFTKIIISKLVYYFVFIGAPLLIFNLPVLPFILGFILMHFITGLILSVIFQLAHTLEETNYPIPNDEQTIENCWAIHQLNTTANFARHNRVITWYVGGLNFQVEHHLFPTVCHVHYRHIAPIVKSTAAEFGIPYLEHKTFWQALGSHIRSLQQFGRPSLDEIMG